MKLIAVPLILLGCGVVYDFTLLQPKHSGLPQVTSQIRYIWPEVKRFVDTHAIIHAAAKRHNVPAAFVKSIVAAESNFDPNAVSPKGAVGLMQLMPATAQEYGADPTIPEQNVDAGTRYLGVLLKRYSKYRNGLSRAIAAYNAGPAVVDRFRGVPPYPETRGYVARVLAFMRQYEKERG
jgi:soluble lytic murein transglycosylase-like protein